MIKKIQIIKVIFEYNNSNKIFMILYITHPKITNIKKIKSLSSKIIHYMTKLISASRCFPFYT